MIYELEEIEDNMFGGKGTIKYTVKNYDGNKEALQKQLEEKADFWESYYVKEHNGKVIVERDIMTLD